MDRSVAVTTQTQARNQYLSPPHQNPRKYDVLTDVASGVSSGSNPIMTSVS